MVKCPHCDKMGYPGGMRTHVRYKHEEDPAERFWSYVDKSGPNGCWLYTMGKDKWGYGDLRWQGKHIQAHRLAWKLLRGDPGKLDCLHTCHNPTCCNPDHLYLGTDKENGRDRVEAQRTAWGERSRHAKLTNEIVRQIRLEYRKDGEWRGARSNSQELAAKYGVRVGAIHSIVSGRTWKYA